MAIRTYTTIETTITIAFFVFPLGLDLDMEFRIKAVVIAVNAAIANNKYVISLSISGVSTANIRNTCKSVIIL